MRAGRPPSARALLWIERLIWVLIYGGLLGASLGLFILRGGSQAWLGWLLIGKGSIAAAVGVLLIGLRSRWR